jgi:beta-glucanase (GH16 family)
VPTTDSRCARKVPRRTKVIAAIAAAGMAAGVFQLLPSAGAEGIVVTQVAGAADAGAVDRNRDGTADYANYGVTNSGLSVGEQPRDGSDLRLFIPFVVSRTAVDAMRSGGTATVSMRVWRTTNLTDQRVIVDAYTNGTAASLTDYHRAATRLVTLTPIEGRLAVDVSRVVRTLSAPGILVLRLSLDRLAPVDGARTQVNVATSESRSPENRPVLTVSSRDASAPAPTPPSQPAPPVPGPSGPSGPPAPVPPAPIPPAPPTPPAPGAGQPPAAVTGGQTWNTIFNDDFNGSAVDASRWNVQNNSNFGTGNNEDQCYRAANTTVANGALRMIGKRETVTGCGSNPDGGSSYYFTSGMVTTRQQGGSMKFKYRQGYAEVRMRVPRGNIYWPAFWLVGAGDGSSPGWPAYGEVDVTEIYGSKPDISESNFHRTGGNIGARNHNVTNKSSSSGLNINPPNPFVAGGTNDWHTYGINWTANQLQWFIDGVLVRTYSASSSADSTALGYEHSIILNLAMGGNGPRYPDHGYTGNESGSGYNDGNLVADLPGAMEVDYVRVWQR